MTQQELYDMKINDFKTESNGARAIPNGKDYCYRIWRVVGGWIYEFANSSTFVPEQSMESVMINPDDKAPEEYRFVE